VLTTYDGDETSIAHCRQGARLPAESMTSEELIATIRAVHAGNRIFLRLSRRSWRAHGTEELTPREFDVLEQIVHG